MASKAVATTSLLLALNLLFFTLVSSNPCPPVPKPHKPHKPKLPPTVPTKPPTVPTKPPYVPTNPPYVAHCPRDTLKLGVCADLLGGLVNIVVGTPPTTPCCTLIQGLADLEAAVCLCTAIKANVLGINLNIPVSLSLLLNTCGKTLPYGFQCA